jgi:hypothetical protein
MSSFYPETIRIAREASPTVMQGLVDLMQTAGTNGSDRFASLLYLIGRASDRGIMTRLKIAWNRVGTRVR